MNIIRSCAFTGHRNMTTSDKRLASDILREMLADLIDNHATTEFYIGGALGFDTVAAVALSHLKKDGYNGKFRMTLVCPHRGQESGWSEYDQAVYNALLPYFDTVVTIADKYISGCMKTRNQYMVDRSDLLIAYVDTARRRSGSVQTYNMAVRKGIPVINIFDRLHAGSDNIRNF